MIFRKIQKHPLLLFFAVLGVYSLFGFVGKAYADYSTVPWILPQDNHQYINLTDGKQDANGVGASLPDSWFKVYSTDSSAKTITLSLTDRRAGGELSCDHYSIVWTIAGVDANENARAIRPGDFGTINITPANCPGDVTFTIPAGALRPSSRPDHAGLHMGLLNIGIWTVAEPTYHTATFRMHTNPAEARIGYLGRDTVPTSQVTIYSSLSASTGGRTNAFGTPIHTLTAEFRPLCTYDFGLPFRFGWGDDDSTSANQISPLNIGMFEFDSSTGALSTDRNPFGFADVIPPGIIPSTAVLVNYRYLDMRARDGHKYNLYFDNVQGGNGISLQYPFDSGDFNFPCIPPPPPVPSVSCTAISVNSPLAGVAGAVLAGSSFSVTLTFHNNDSTYSAPANYNGGNISGSVSTYRGGWANPPPPPAYDGWYPNDVSGQIAGGIPPGGDVNVTVGGFTAPGSIGTYQLSMYADYQGVMAMGGCPVLNLDTFLEFDHDLTAASTPDNYESPKVVNWTTEVRQTKPPGKAPTIPGETKRRLFKRPAGGGPDVLLQGEFVSPPGSRFDDETKSEVYTDPDPLSRTFAPGDQICAYIELNNDHGFIGPGDRLIGVTGDKTDNCPKVVNQPFVRVYGGDVSAGGNFEGEAGVGSGDIKAYVKEATNIAEGYEYGAGSGAEFAAFAVGVIESTDPSTGFTTASLRNVAPNAPSGLSFAGPAAGEMGGLFGPHQASDYFGRTRDLSLTRTTDADNIININSDLPDKKQTYTKPAGTKITLTNGTNFNKHHALYIEEGDVFIDTNITYAGTGGWANLDAIPSFQLFVKKGNIYISRNVTKLDGLFVVQPSGGTGGKIYTCVKSSGDRYVESSAPDKAALFSECSNKLEVNGAFVAQEIKLLRTKGSLSDVPALPRVPGLPVKYKKETFGDDTAAESFRLTPELYLAQPVLQPEKKTTSGRYDQILSLPPIL